MVEQVPSRRKLLFYAVCVRALVCVEHPFSNVSHIHSHRHPSNGILSVVPSFVMRFVLFHPFSHPIQAANRTTTVTTVRFTIANTIHKQWKIEYILYKNRWAQKCHCSFQFQVMFIFTHLVRFPSDVLSKGISLIFSCE